MNSDCFRQHTQRDFFWSHAPDVETYRNPHPRQLLVRYSLAGEKVEQRTTATRAPQHADLRRLAGQDRLQDGQVVLVVMRQQDDQRFLA